MAPTRVGAGMVTATSARSTESAAETSERWTTAIHEAAHTIVAEQLGARVKYCLVTSDQTGRTNNTATGLPLAVVAVAGERATRLLCGAGGGSTTDYQQATAELRRTGHDIAWAEHQADQAITANRREIRRDATRLYRKGRR